MSRIGTMDTKIFAEEVSSMNEFSGKPFLKSLYARNARSMPFPEEGASFPEWREKAQNTLKRLLAVRGCPPIPRLGTVVETRRLDGGFVRERILMRTAPELWMTAFLLYKDGAPERKPAAMIPPAEGAGKFGVVWSDDFEAVQKANASVRKTVCRNWDFSFALAEKGYLVFAPDTMGCGERREWMDEGEDKFFTCSHRVDNNVAIALGESLGGLIVHELQTAADYLETRSDYSGKLIACGTESAAAISVMFALCDERVSRVYAQNWLYNIETTALRTGDVCACACVPGLWRFFGNRDLAAMLAPRTLVVSGCSEDELSLAARAYALAGCASRLVCVPADADTQAMNIRAIDILTAE